MAKSYNSYVGNGSTQVFSLSFPYLAQSHVKVYVGGVEDTTFTWLTSSSLTLSSVPASGDVVLIKRVTPTTPLIDFVDGSVVTESLLDTATIQSMYIAEETQDTAATAIIYDQINDVWKGNAKRLSNLADPVDAQDAVTKDWAETALSSQLTQATAQATTATAQATIATTQATNAAASASTATTKATEASTSATNSANSATASASSATASAASASTATTKASEASGSATSAAGSASTATTKATEAANSATNAAVSAADAATSATSAAASASSAAALLDNFDDRYLGAKSSAPTVDNDGNALLLGALYFDSTTGKMRVYTASGWIDASSASVATLAKYEYVSTAGQTTFTGADANGVTLAYTVGAIVVSLNGALLRSNEYTASSGSSVVLASAANAGDELVVYAFGNFLVADTYSRAEADALLANKLSNANNSVLPTKLANGGFELGMRNRIINGAMMIDQRNAGASVTASNGSFGVDRFKTAISGSGVFTMQQSSTAPSGFTYSQAFTVTTADTSIIAGDEYSYRHYIEGYNTADLMWGTSNAQTVTLSFWVRSSITGTYAVGFRNNDATRTYPATYTINSANTWEYKTVTVAGDITGTWNTTNQTGISLIFSLGAGSGLQGTANTWNNGNLWSTSTATQWISTLGATFYITGVQLEKGSTATSFDYRPYGTELALCQRYYEKGFAIDTAPADGSGDYFNGGGLGAFAFAVNALRTLPITYRVEKRASPTVTLYRPGAIATANTWAYYTGGAWAVMTTGSIETSGSSTNTFAVRSGATSVAGSSYMINGAWTSSAEL